LESNVFYASIRMSVSQKNNNQSIFFNLTKNLKSLKNGKKSDFCHYQCSNTVV